MKTIKRAIIVLILLTGVTTLAFSEVYYSFSVGGYRFIESFLNEDYDREQSGAIINLSLNVQPENSPLGFFIQTSFNSPSMMREWDSEVMKSLDTYSLSIFDMRIFAAPTYIFNLGNKFRLPLSVGTVFSIYRDSSSYYDFYPENNDSYINDSFYDAFRMGVFLDASLLIIPRRWFFFKHGFSIGWDFLQAERGVLPSHIRTTYNTRYTAVPYSAFFGSLYFGIGMSFR